MDEDDELMDERARVLRKELLMAKDQVRMHGDRVKALEKQLRELGA